jgi:DNA-binding NtrC family response regulator
MAPIWRICERTLVLDRPLIMGIVNVTPDSFSDGGAFLEHSAAIAHARRLIADGADILDIGGESTRPGAEPVEADEELRRVIPVIEALSPDRAIPISVDTSKMTGLQLAKYIQEKYAGLPIILATGYAELPGDPALLGLLRLAKPCNQYEIATAIQTALRSRTVPDKSPSLSAVR